MLTLSGRRNFLLFLLFLFFLWSCDGTPPDTNYPPFFTSNPVITATINVLYSYDVNAIDPDDDLLTYTLSIAPADMTIDPSSGLINWTPTQEASTSVTVEVTDGEYTESQDFVITFQVTPPPVQPIQNITQGTGYDTIQAALNAANSGDTIQVSDGLYSESLTFPVGRVIILQSVNGPTVTHIEGLPGSSAITCNGSPGGTQITGFHISHAAGVYGQGIYHTNGSIRVSNCNIDHHNSTQSGGGGIKNDQATLTISGCSITLNSTFIHIGGGILNLRGTVIIEGASIIAKNSSPYHGGGISNVEGTMNILGSTVSENVSADWWGGGIYNELGTLSIIGSTVSKNSAGNGGGIMNIEGTLNISGGSIISQNVASGSGGGIENYNSALTIQASTISENSAAYNGGGIYINPESSPAVHIIGGSSASDTTHFNSFINNKQGDTISSAQHIRSYDSGDVHGNFPNNYYTP